MSLLVSIQQKPEDLSKAAGTLRDYIGKMRDRAPKDGKVDIMAVLEARRQKETDKRDKYGK